MAVIRELVTKKFCHCSLLMTGGPAGTCDSVTNKLQETLQKYFSYSSFREGQLEALLPLLHGRHVFVHMATGSMCMFLGPLALHECAIGMIVSPLNELMEQQLCCN